MDCDEELPISVRVCPAGRERNPSGCRASCLTPALPVHVVMVPPLLVLLLLRLQALVPGVQRQSIAIAISWIALESFVFARCSGFEKALDFTGAGQGIVQSTLPLSFDCSTEGICYRRGRLSDGFIVMKLNKTHFNIRGIPGYFG